MNAKQLLRQAVDKLDAMPQRDRFALLAAGVALLLGVEFLGILPLQTQRQNLVASTVAQSETQAQAQSLAEAEMTRQKDLLSTQLATLDQTLVRLGVSSGTVGTRGESLSFLLSRTLQGLSVRTVSLRTLEVEEMTVAPAAPDEVALDPAALPSPEAQALFRHRYELRLGGDFNALAQAVQTLENGARPLRLEKVRIARVSTGDELVAIVTLVTVGLERSWLSL